MKLVYKFKYYWFSTYIYIYIHIIHMYTRVKIDGTVPPNNWLYIYTHVTRMPHFLRVGSSSPSVFDIRCNSASSFPSNGGSTSGGNLRRLRNVQKKPCMTFQYSDWLIGILTLAQKNLPIELGSITHYNNYMSGALSTAQVNRCFPKNKSEVLVVKNMFQCKCHTTSITKHTYFL